MKRLINLISITVLLSVSFFGFSAYSIDVDEWQNLNLGTTIYYGGEESSRIHQCETSAYTGDLPPVRLPQINDEQGLADALDAYIEERNESFERDTPFLGMGSYFVEGGIRTGINPIFVITVATHESQLATFPTGIHLEPDGNNAFGRKASGSQPSFERGGEDWYQYPSWEESLYSQNFPSENGDVGDEDDQFQYIARRFDNLLDDPDAMLEVYAPSFENDPVAYRQSINSLTDIIMEEAGDAVNMTRVSSGGTSCDFIGGDVVETALQYAWPDNQGSGRTEQTDAYRQAHQQAVSAGEYRGGCGGNDCGAFTTRVIRDSGFDPEFNNQEGDTSHQKAYMDDSDRWEEIGRGGELSTSELEPGDVAIWTREAAGTNFGHTFLYVGSQPDFETRVASASVSSDCSNARAPEAGVESLTNPRITWYRLSQ